MYMSIDMCYNNDKINPDCAKGGNKIIYIDETITVIITWTISAWTTVKRILTQGWEFIKCNNYYLFNWFEIKRCSTTNSNRNGNCNFNYNLNHSQQ